MTKPEPRTLPFTNSFSGGDFSQIRGVTEHYFPSKYNDFDCVVSNFDVEIRNFRQMEVKISFRLEGSEGSIEKLYEDEGWKFMRTRYLLERFPEKAGKFSHPAPLFCLMLNKYLQVVDAKIERKDGREIEYVYDTDADLLAMPTSFPPLAEMPSEENYVYYEKKSVVFYSDIDFNVQYQATILLEANAATFEFAPLFPFGNVIFESISTVSTSEYEITPNAWRVYPAVNNAFPEWFQYQLDRILSTEIRQIRFRAASPYRGDFPLFDLVEEVVSTSSGEIAENEIFKLIEQREIDLSKIVILKDYETIRFGFTVVIPPDKDIDIIVRSIQRPLPPRIYEQMQKLPSYSDVLVEYDIFNLSHDKLRLRIETEILGYSEKEKRSVFIHGMKNSQNQKSRKLLTQCPRLKKDILEQLTIPVKATMSCKVTNEDTKDILFDETFPIDILANDEMVWELKDIRSNQTYNLRDFICAWVTPTDKNRLLDKVRSEAKSFHPDGILGHKTSTFGDVLAHAKALYDYLAKNGMAYLNQPFSSQAALNGQRVVLPERVLENNAGNCIDLTILFASLLEGFGIYSLIFIVPGHAFIGWGDKNNHKKMVFLETTLIGKSDFETALTAGRKVFEDNFMLNGGPEPMYLPDIHRMKGNFIVDLQKARYSGQVSARQG